MITLEEARNKILATIKRTCEESVAARDAYHRVCLKKIIAPRDLPLFDTSDIDGYAIITSDVLTATEDDPVELNLVTVIRPGEYYENEMNPGECAQVFAGSRLPRGADAVIPAEFTQNSPAGKNKILIKCSTRPWDNIRKRGEDLMYGAVIANSGDRLSTAQITLLAALGIKSVVVARQPEIFLISIGSELKSSDKEAKPGEIYESNLIMLTSMIKKQVSPHIKEFLIPDEEEKIFQTIKTAFETSDVVITTGRISEGKLDVVKNALARIPELRFENWRVMMKPGRSFIFGVYREKKYLFGLPGNPVSAAVSYSLIVRPALLKMTGCSNIDLPVEECELAEDILNPSNRHHFVRVKIDVNKKAKIAGLQTSYSLSSLLNSSGLVDVPPRSVLEKGSIVKVLKWDISD